MESTLTETTTFRQVGVKMYTIVHNRLVVATAEAHAAGRGPDATPEQREAYIRALDRNATYLLGLAEGIGLMAVSIERALEEAGVSPKDLHIPAEPEVSEQ